MSGAARAVSQSPQLLCAEENRGHHTCFTDRLHVGPKPHHCAPATGPEPHRSTTAVLSVSGKLGPPHPRRPSRAGAPLGALCVRKAASAAPGAGTVPRRGCTTRAVTPRPAGVGACGCRGCRGSAMSGACSRAAGRPRDRPSAQQDGGGDEVRGGGKAELTGTRGPWSDGRGAICLVFAV